MLVHAEVLVPMQGPPADLFDLLTASVGCFKFFDSKNHEFSQILLIKHHVRIFEVFSEHVILRKDFSRENVVLGLALCTRRESFVNKTVQEMGDKIDPVGV